MPASQSSGAVTKDGGVPSATSHRPMLAISLRLSAGIVWATMLVLVKLSAQGGANVPQMLLIRHVVSAGILLAWLAMRGNLGLMRTDRMGAHGTRAMTGTLGMALNFGAPILLPLAVATTLGFTTPIFAVILSALFLREHVGPWRWAAVVSGFVGVLVIAGPGGEEIPLWGAAVGIGAALMVAIISIQIRDLSQTENSYAIVTWFAIFSVPILLPVTLFFPWPDEPTTYALMIGIALCGTVGQLLLTNSLRYGPVSSVIVMDYAMLIWATLFGWTIFGNLPPAHLWLGAPLIIGAGAIIVWREHRASRDRPATREY